MIAYDIIWCNINTESFRYLLQLQHILSCSIYFCPCLSWKALHHVTIDHDKKAYHVLNWLKWQRFWYPSWHNGTKSYLKFKNVFIYLAQNNIFLMGDYINWLAEPIRVVPSCIRRFVRRSLEGTRQKYVTKGTSLLDVKMVTILIGPLNQ